MYSLAASRALKKYIVDDSESEFEDDKIEVLNSDSSSDFNIMPEDSDDDSKKKKTELKRKANTTSDEDDILQPFKTDEGMEFLFLSENNNNYFYYKL